jgi:hypothetical protein
MKRLLLSAAGPALFIACSLVLRTDAMMQSGPAAAAGAAAALPQQAILTA